MEWLPVRYTYDEEANAVYLYLVDSVGRGEAKRSSVVPLELRGASITVDFDDGGHALGIEFLGASSLFTAEALNAIRAGRSPVGEGPTSSSRGD